MKIATWNVSWPAPSKDCVRTSTILEELRKLQADILILTETNESIDLSSEYEYCSCSTRLSSGKGRREVMVWSKFPKTQEVPTFDPAVSTCAGFETEHGELLVYGTVIGVLGHPNAALDAHVADWIRISKCGSICIAGDFNTTFIGGGKFTHEARSKLFACFSALGVDNLTSQIKDNIDHIAILKSWFSDATTSTCTWNLEKNQHVPRLSDHVGVSVTLDFEND